MVLARQGGRSRVSNVKTCGLRHECANCATQGLAERAIQIRNDVDVWLGSDRSVVSVTLLGPPHSKRDRLARLAGCLEAGITAALRKGRPARRLRAKYGIVAIDRTNESPWTAEAGWHPHAHLLLYVDEFLSTQRLQALREDLTEIHLNALRREGALATRLADWAAHKVAVDVRRVTSPYATAAYLTKAPVVNGRATGHFAILETLHEHHQQCGGGHECKVCRRLVATWREFTEHARSSPRFTAPRNFDKVLRERGLVRRATPAKEATAMQEICLVAGKAWDLAVRLDATEDLKSASLGGGIEAVREAVASLLVAEGSTETDAIVGASRLVRPPQVQLRSRLRGHRFVASLRAAWRLVV